MTERAESGEPSRKTSGFEEGGRRRLGVAKCHTLNSLKKAIVAC